jgi:monoamine oxidase
LFAGSDMAPSVFRSFWMEGAIESGHLAADRALAFLNVPAVREHRSHITR